MASKIKLDPINIKTNIGGIDVQFPTELSISIETETDKVLFNAESVINLKNLQDNFFTILKSLPLKMEEGKGQKIEIKSIDSGRFYPEGDNAILEASISCIVWQLGVPIPVPRTKIIDLGLLGKHKVPTGDVDIVYSGDLKTKLIEEGFNAKIRFSLSTPDSKSIDISNIEPEVYPRGDIGKFINWILSFVKGDLNHFVKGQLYKIINDGLIRQTFPESLNKYSPSIISVQFKTISEGVIGISTNFEAILSEDEIAEIIKDAIT